MHGLMRHKTRGSEMKVVIWRITENVSVDMDSLSRVVSKINSPRFHIDRRLSPRRRMVAGLSQGAHRESAAKILQKGRFDGHHDRLQVAENEGSCAQPFRSVRRCGVSSVLSPQQARASPSILKVKRSLSASCMSLSSTCCKAALSQGAHRETTAKILQGGRF